ncbi:hypothetical protein IV203_002764 [Nitzschia inconspicua]|uniref:Uncharacterized protein n=1 Tax=Nitzschia inconspicua TaxID=303405 RepID=A0A9K3L1E6_9STRA|nr:hypothetical protein IV203_002764 [Nitzschia inconspicua]
MGAETSKQVHPPEDWEPMGARKAFEVISPVSDISNPSDIHKLSHHRPRQLHLKGGNKNHIQNHSMNHSRRVSRTVTTTLPIATKVPRRSSSSNSNRGNPQMPAPSSFYFPTKETERFAERAAKSNDSGGSSSDKENRNIQSVARQEAAKKTSIRKKIVKKMTACLDDRKDGNMEPVPVLQERLPHLVQAKLPVAQIVSGKPRGRKSSTSSGGAPPGAKHSKSTMTVSVPDSQFQDEDCKEEQLSALLHQEDEYFNRLSMSPSSLPAASPFVSNAANRVTAILEKPSGHRLLIAGDQKINRSAKRDRLNTTMDMDAMTPSSQLVKRRGDSDDASVDTPVSDLFSASSSIPGLQHDDKMLSMRSMKTNSSVASSLMRFYTKSGPMGSSPLTYNSEVEEEIEETKTIQVFSDEQSNTSSQSNEIDGEDIPFDEDGSDKRKSIESHSSLYTTESTAYENPSSKDLQMLVHKENTSNRPISFQRPKTNSLALVKPPVKNRPIAHVATFGDNDDDATSSVIRDSKVSKLESLFRPILPAFSTDDAQSLPSYDPREIKVTESAPGVIQSSKFISLARRSSSLTTTSQPKNRHPWKKTPSQLSVDSQPSPELVKNMVSEQAETNADFLFASDYGPVLIAGDPHRSRDSTNRSISTSGARSRLTQRSCQPKRIDAPGKSMDEADAKTLSDCSYRSERRVRFSSEAVDGEIDVTSEINRTVSDLTDTASGKERRSSGIISLCSSGERNLGVVHEEDERCDASPMNLNGSWAYNKGKDAGVTPFLKGKALKKAINSPFLRFQAAKEKFDATVGPSGSFAESIDVPEIQNHSSDMTGSGGMNNGRTSSESMNTNRSSRSIPESIPEEDESEIENEGGEMSPENSIHWRYNEKGVTPFVKGKSGDVENPAQSPARRFKDAKNKFSNVDSIVRPRSIATTTSPKEEKRIVKKGSGGLVSARIEELNSRVTEIRKLKRMRKKLTNPRLHTHNFDNQQPVRNRALLNYKTSIKSADIEKSNSYMAAKFNVIPDIDEDSAISSLGPSPRNGATFLSGPSPMNSIVSEDDNASKVSHGTFGTSGTGRTEGTVATVATVVQQKDNRAGRYRAYSESTMSTTSSGISKVRKQMLFRVSDGTKSLSSNDESTTLSAIIHKENEFFPPAALHLSPVQRTPMQAMKWRSLAAAVQEKDARYGKKNKKVALGSRNNNY